MQLSDGAAKRSGVIFKNLTDSEREMIIALPYRVGLYISQSDDDGGDEAHEQEIQTLHNIILEIAQDYCKSEIMQHIMVETVANRENWSKWDDKIENVPDECERTIFALESLVEQRSDLQSVKDIMIDIGLAVAMAFREDDDRAAQGSSNVVGGVMQKVVSIFKPTAQQPVLDDRFTHLNVSARERESLLKIVDALQ